jgi:hypothetical protein
MLNRAIARLVGPFRPDNPRIMHLSYPSPQAHSRAALRNPTICMVGLGVAHKQGDGVWSS